MGVTDILRSEHDIVLLKLDALDLAARDGDFDRIRALLPFFERDIQLHRRKEEEVLFPILMRYVGASSGPVSCMLHEHQEEKNLVAALRAAVDPAEGKDRKPAAPEVLQRTLDFTSFLRSHIHKENEVLFLIAEEVMNPAEKERAFAEMGRIGACCDVCAGHSPLAAGSERGA